MRVQLTCVIESVNIYYVILKSFTLLLDFYRDHIIIIFHCAFSARGSAPLHAACLSLFHLLKFRSLSSDIFLNFFMNTNGTVCRHVSKEMAIRLYVNLSKKSCRIRKYLSLIYYVFFRRTTKLFKNFSLYFFI